MKTSKSFAEKINSAQLMNAAMQKYAETVTTRGWTTEKNEQLEELRQKAIALNDLQEQIKGELKKQTEELDAQMHSLEEQMREAIKVVKLAMPQVTWVEFGIHATR
ncbi:MAG: hypothetical protein ACRCZB_05810 [Bacteroidales bacterium]